jgi:hypothetical protein
MRKKLISYSIITFILFGGVLFLNNQTKIESHFTLRAAEQPEGLSSISFTLSGTSTVSYNSDGTHNTTKFSLDNVVNGSNDLITGYSGIDKVYPGNQSGGYGTSTTTLKFGSSGAVGTMTIAAKYSVHKVVINYATWHATKKSQLKVNGVSGQEVARLTFADETFDLSTPSTTVTIETTFPTSGDRRVGIARIDLYHRCGL